jgi:hypothetical protein
VTSTNGCSAAASYATGGNYLGSSDSKTITILTYTDQGTIAGPASAVYESMVTLTGTLNVAALNNVPAATQAQFKICGANGASPCQTMGTANVVGGFASLTTALVETTPGALNPANPHTVVVTFSGTQPSGAPNFAYSLNQPSLQITPASATPPSGWGTMYTGASVFWTPGTNSSTATLFLSATVFDPNCAAIPAYCSTSPGITKSTLTFGIRNPTSNTFTPIAGATNLPIGLVDPTNPAVGSAAKTVQYSIPGGSTSAQLQIAVIVNGSYVTANSTAYDYLVTVAIPPTSGSLLFAGTSICNSANGIVDPQQNSYPCSTSNGTYQYPETGIFPGTASSLAQVQGGVQWSKSGTNPHGQILAQVNSYYLPNGQKDTVPHTYVLKSNAISTFVVNSANGVGTWAQFTSKASITDITTGAGVDGGALMNITVCAANQACPVNPSSSTSTTFKAGPNGAVSIQVNNSKAGGVWFVDGWNGVNSVPENAVTGSIEIVP